jgi:hypothetical protein
VGDKAYLETKDFRLWVKQKRRSAKLYSCPFEISKAEPKTLNYTLKLPDEYQIHPKVHAYCLKEANENDPGLFPGQVPPKPPLIDTEDNQYTSRSSLTITLFEGNESSWFIGKDVLIQRIHELKRWILT